MIKMVKIYFNDFMFSSDSLVFSEIMSVLHEMDEWFIWYIVYGNY